MTITSQKAQSSIYHTTWFKEISMVLGEDAHLFPPERWLDVEPSTMKRMGQIFWAARPTSIGRCFLWHMNNLAKAIAHVLLESKMVRV